MKSGGLMSAKVFHAMFFVLGMALLAGTGYAEDFSADMVSSSSEGTFIGKIYVSGEKSRMEMPEASTISRMDKKVSWVLMPGQKMYMEQPIDARAAAGTQEKMSGEIERSVEGNETVDGRVTTKYRVTFEAQGKRETIFQWIDEAAHVLVKTAAIDGSWSTEFKNIKAGLQDQELFEIPAGYNKMSLSMPDMGDMGE
jgi:hypothetical protein